MYMNLILFAFCMIDLFIVLILTFHANVFDMNGSVGPKHREWMMLIEHDSTVVFTGTSENRQTDEINKLVKIMSASHSIGFEQCAINNKSDA